MELMRVIVPELNIEVNLKTHDNVLKFILTGQLPWCLPDKLKKCGENQENQILIRKNDFKIYKFEGRSKSLDRWLAQQSTADGLYLDPIDAEMLIQRHEAATQSNSSQSPKWLNLCWDAFRIVDNHSKSHIFQTVVPSHLQSRKPQIQPVDRIRESLQ